MKRKEKIFPSTENVAFLTQQVKQEDKKVAPAKTLKTRNISKKFTFCSFSRDVRMKGLTPD